MMGQSMGSIGNSRKQGRAGDQFKNQPEVRPGQKMADQGGAKTKDRPETKPEGGADHGTRSTR
jgi:hypothetical protein